ncbi:MAG: metallophosphoesterase [Candidatus Margulisbacteria bacterium]|nr:metallophosphoesterase [Candidatus Margulisiibacteriota bacterium]
MANVAAAQPSFWKKAVSGLKSLLPGVSHKISEVYRRLNVANLSHTFQLSELIHIVSYLADEAKVTSQLFVRRGALIKLNAARETVVVGDLHGNAARLDAILRKYGARLAAGEINLVFLGDAIHPENPNGLGEMRSSLQVLNTVIRLKQMFPEQVHFLLGNHDVIKSKDFQMNEAKGGVPQAIAFYFYLQDFLKQEGYSQDNISRYAAAYQAFFDGCALAVIIEGGQGATYLSHAGIVRGGITQAELVNARNDASVFKQLLVNRHIEEKDLAEIVRVKPEKAERYYVIRDVLAMITKLGLRASPSFTYFLTGHTPDEARGWAYQSFRGINHFIIHGNIPNQFGAAVIRNGRPSFEAIVVDQLTAAAA